MIPIRGRSEKGKTIMTVKKKKKSVVARGSGLGQGGMSKWSTGKF